MINSDDDLPLNKQLKFHNTVKPVLTTIFLKPPPVVNDHVMVLP